MTLNALLPSDSWDLPFFKVLANNDTGAARGHQAGIVIPIELRLFFPGLLNVTSAVAPTTEQRVEAELYIESRFIRSVSTRYQYQTWGDTRRPESRLTDQLSSLRNLAVGGDVIIFQRSMDRFDKYKLTLVRQTSQEFSELAVLIRGRRWGLLGEAPLSETDLISAVELQHQREILGFELFDREAATVETRSVRVARSLAFKRIVTSLYDFSCAVCNEALRSPHGSVEVDAAHIVPRSRLGMDDARNGFTLCKRHHWAFDNGLFGVSEERTIVIPEAVQGIAQNHLLIDFHGANIREPDNINLRVHRDAFAWHRDNVLL